jgi:hypothetical protein
MEEFRDHPFMSSSQLDSFLSRGEIGLKDRRVSMGFSGGKYLGILVYLENSVDR